MVAMRWAVKPRSWFWLINHSLAQGYAVLKGHYLMTGSLGRVQLATPGHYIAQYMCDDAGAPKRFGAN